MKPTTRRDYHEPSPPPTQSPLTSPQSKSTTPGHTSHHHTHRSLTSRPQHQQADNADPFLVQRQEDEIQLVKVSNTATRQEFPQQRNDYIARVYQKSPTRIASSPRLLQSATTTDHSSWQEDASTEPITPMIYKTADRHHHHESPSSPIYHTPKRRTIIKTIATTNSPTRGNTSHNPIEISAPPARPKISLSKSKNKRKADDVGLTPSTTATKSPRLELEIEKTPMTPTPSTSIASAAQRRSLLKSKTPIASTPSTLQLQQRESHINLPENMMTDKNVPGNQQEAQKKNVEEKNPRTVKNDEATTMDLPQPTTQSTSTAASTDRSNKKLTKEEEATKVHEEIDHLMKTVKCLPNYYKLVDKIGEGTFSTVYKALDIRREFYNNDDWEPHLLNSPSSSRTPSPSQSPISTSSQQQQDDTSQPQLPSTPTRSSNHSKTSNQYVALKRIYHTSSPRRIANEIGILKRLKGSPCISPLITAFRQQDQVFVVMPYIQHDDFKATFYQFSMTDIKHYLRSLFTALTHLHKHHILHRDVKPNNFLYNIRKKSGYLIDFGLAEHEKDGQMLEAYAAKLESKVQNNIFVKSSREAALAASNGGGSSSSQPSSSSSSVLVAMTNKENRITTTASSSQSSVGTTSTTAAEDGAIDSQSQQQQQKRIVGYVKNDARHQVRANRAGTRGFRAPEILMRVTRQTCAIDIWAVGVIFLCFLSGRYPFFLANDESDSIIELCQIYGYNEMKKCAENYNRNFDTNLYIPTHRAPLHKLCEHLNKEKMATWDKNEFLQGIDLLGKCMDLNNKTRITAAQALNHPFLIIHDESSSHCNTGASASSSQNTQQN